jgi:hypothetical protein
VEPETLVLSHDHILLQPHHLSGRFPQIMAQKVVEAEFAWRRGKREE